MTMQEQVKSLGEFADRGFTLVRPDNHVCLLMHEGEQIAVFSQTGATQKGLQRECARHLAKKHCTLDKQEEIEAVHEGHSLAKEHLVMDGLVDKKLA